MNIIIPTAILSIAAIEIIALFKGIDGALMLSSFTIIGGLVGYYTQKDIEKIKEKVQKFKQLLLH